MARTIITKIIELLNMNKIVKFVRCDNAGENTSIEKLIVIERIEGVTMEYTAPKTPQQNGIVERSFAFQYNKVHAMLNQAGITDELRKKLWAECASTATLLENASVRHDKSSHELFFGKPSKIWKELRGFGEIVVVKKGGMRSKLENKGIIN